MHEISKSIREKEAAGGSSRPGPSMGAGAPAVSAGGGGSGHCEQQQQQRPPTPPPLANGFPIRSKGPLQIHLVPYSGGCMCMRMLFISMCSNIMGNDLP